MDFVKYEDSARLGKYKHYDWAKIRAGEMDAAQHAALKALFYYHGSLIGK